MNDKQATIGFLRKARALVAKGWRQGGQARNADGYPCSPCSSEAVAWCVLGACNAVSAAEGVPLQHGTCAFDAWSAIGETVRDRIGRVDVVHWNDTEGCTQEEVLALFDETIARVERDGDGDGK